jgi:hypothetical protein
MRQLAKPPTKRKLRAMRHIGVSHWRKITLWSVFLGEERSIKMTQLSDDQFSVQVGSFSQLLQGAVIGGLLAGGINFLIYSVGFFFLDATFALAGQAPVEQVTLVMVAFASLLPAVAAAGLLYTIAKYQRKNAFRIFIIVALAVLVVSLYSPYEAAVQTVDALLLIAMHFVAMFAILWGIYQFGTVKS